MRGRGSVGISGQLRSGNLVLSNEEMTDEEISSMHRAPDTAVYYVDGSARRGWGAGAFVKPVGPRVLSRLSAGLWAVLRILRRLEGRERSLSHER